MSAARPARGARELLRDLGALALGEVLAKLAGFAAFAYLARTLTAERYGGVELAVAISMIFFLAIDFGFAPVGARELARDRGLAARLAGAIPTLRLGLALASVACIWIGSAFLDQPEETRLLVRVFGLSLLGAPWILNWLFQGLGRMFVVAAAPALRMSAFALAAFALVRNDMPLWRIGAMEIFAAAVMALYYLAMQSRAGISPALSMDIPQMRTLWREAGPIGVSRILWALSQYTATLIVAAFSPAADLAWYGAAHRLSMALSAFVLVYHFNLFPALVEAVAAGPQRLRALLDPLYRAAVWLAAFGGLFGTLFAADLCALLYGPPFAASGAVFAWLVWSLSLALVGAHARYVLLAAGQQRAELAANALGAAVALLAGLALVPHYGMRGGAAAIVLGSAATWALAHALATRFVAPLPGLAPLLRPALACAAAALAAPVLPIANELARDAAALALFSALAPLTDAALRRDMIQLLRGRGARR